MDCNWLSGSCGTSPSPSRLAVGYSEARQAAGQFGAIRPVASLKWFIVSQYVFIAGQGDGLVIVAVTGPFTFTPHRQ